MDLIDRIREYAQQGWMPTMIQIWQEKIERLRIRRTGALHESFRSALLEVQNGQTINLRFYQYGIYQALGVGNHYTHGNGGDLPFLGKEYRAQHGLDVPRKVGPGWGGYTTSGQPRKARDWYSKKLYLSVMNLKEELAVMTADQAATVICDALMDTRSALR